MREHLNRAALALALSIGLWLIAPREPEPVVAQAAYTCSQVIGYSQTRGWFLAGFEDYVPNASWESKTANGASIDRWADPSFGSWQQQPESRCAAGSGLQADRVVLSVSGSGGGDVSWWETNIMAAVANVRFYYPNVRSIVLIPVVGGPNHAVCTVNGQPVNASVVHPYVDQAIANVTGGDVVAGYSPEVTACSEYSDATGHLTSAGYGGVAERIGLYYAGQAAPAATPTATLPPTSTPEPTAPPEPTATALPTAEPTPQPGEPPGCVRVVIVKGVWIGVVDERPGACDPYPTAAPATILTPQPLARD